MHGVLVVQDAACIVLPRSGRWPLIAMLKPSTPEETGTAYRQEGRGFCEKAHAR